MIAADAVREENYAKFEYQRGKKYILAEQFSNAKELLYPLAYDNNAEAQLILGYLYYGEYRSSLSSNLNGPASLDRQLFMIQSLFNLRRFYEFSSQ